MSFLDFFRKKAARPDPSADAAIVQDIESLIESTLSDKALSEEMQAMVVDEILCEYLPQISGDSAYSLCSILLIDAQMDRASPKLQDVYDQHFCRSMERAETLIVRFH